MWLQNASVIPAAQITNIASMMFILVICGLYRSLTAGSEKSHELCFHIPSEMRNIRTHSNDCIAMLFGCI